MGPGAGKRSLSLKVMTQDPQSQGTLFGLASPAVQGPPSPLPPSLFPRVGRGGRQGWPAGNDKKQDASFPQQQEPQDGHGMEELASVSKQALGPYRGIVQCLGKMGVGEELRQLLESSNTFPLA